MVLAIVRARKPLKRFLFHLTLAATQLKQGVNERANMEANFLSRRDFVKTVAVSGAAVATGLSALAQNEKPARKIKLGFDNFAVRALKWNTSQLIDYAVQL